VADSDSEALSKHDVSGRIGESPLGMDLRWDTTEEDSRVFVSARCTSGGDLAALIQISPPPDRSLPPLFYSSILFSRAPVSAFN
jgi:hypothetical protein